MDVGDGDHGAGVVAAQLRDEHDGRLVEEALHGREARALQPARRHVLRRAGTEEDKSFILSEVSLYSDLD